MIVIIEPIRGNMDRMDVELSQGTTVDRLQYDIPGCIKCMLVFFCFEDEMLNCHASSGVASVIPSR